MSADVTIKQLERGLYVIEQPNFGFVLFRSAEPISPDGFEFESIKEHFRRANRIDANKVKQAAWIIDVLSFYIWNDTTDWFTFYVIDQLPMRAGLASVCRVAFRSNYYDELTNYIVERFRDGCWTTILNDKVNRLTDIFVVINKFVSRTSAIIVLDQGIKP